DLVKFGASYVALPLVRRNPPDFDFAVAIRPLIALKRRSDGSFQMEGLRSRLVQGALFDRSSDQLNIVRTKRRHTKEEKGQSSGCQPDQLHGTEFICFDACRQSVQPREKFSMSCRPHENGRIERVSPICAISASNEGTPVNIHPQGKSLPQPGMTEC